MSGRTPRWIGLVAVLGACEPMDADGPSLGDGGIGLESTPDDSGVSSADPLANQDGEPAPTLAPPSELFQTLLQQASQPAAQAAALGIGPSGLGYFASPLHISAQTPGLHAQALQNLPASYDLRTTGKLTAVKDQGNCGSCWAFATYGAAESQLLTGEANDLSEEHLNDWSGFDIGACNGGNAWMSIAYMSRWAGPVAEASDPYTAGASSKLNQDKPVIKHLQSALFIADRTGPLDNDAIKSAVMTYGGVMTTMSWSGSGWNGSTSSYYVPATSAYANHAVTIVGWDDNYAASKFSKAPPGKGAFLIRNSWGTSFGEAGYFHISYYDGYVGLENNVYDVLAATTDFSAVYQYDKYGATATLRGSGTVHYQANIYTATSTARLSAVGFYALVPGTTVDVELWANPVGANPSSGTRIGVLSGVAEPYAGYHTISLAGLGVQVQSGQTFSVVLRLTASQVAIPIEYPFSGYSSHVVARTGVSFYGVNSQGSPSWTDVGSHYKANLPIKVFVGGATGSCDDGNPCTTDTGTPGNCQHTAVKAGTVCRAAAGPCDKAEVCNGTAAACPTDKVQPKTLVCHAAAGPCDSAVNCDGTAKTCADAQVRAKGTVCRAAAGACDNAEVCDGQNPTCPTNALLARGTLCRAAAGVCDAAETCTGTSAACPGNTFVPKTTQCRAAAGVCDVAEMCNGSSASCPANTMRPKGYVCSAAAKTICSGTGVTCVSK